MAEGDNKGKGRAGAALTAFSGLSVIGCATYCIVWWPKPARARGLALVLDVLTLPVGVLALYASLSAGGKASELKDEQSPPI